MTAFRDGGYDTGVAAAVLAENLIVKRDSNSKLVLATAGTDDIAGVVEKGATKVRALVSFARVNGQGSFKVRAGATIAKGALLTAGTGGKAVTATTGNRVFGVAKTAAVSGDVVEYEKVDRVA